MDLYQDLCKVACFMKWLKNKWDEQCSRFASAISDWFGDQRDDDDIIDDVEEKLDNIE